MPIFRRGCRWVRRQRWRYLDQTLSESERAAVERHLSTCIACRALIAEAQLALEMHKKGQPLPPNLKQKLEPPRTISLVRIALVLIVLALGAGAVYWSFSPEAKAWILRQEVVFPEVAPDAPKPPVAVLEPSPQSAPPETPQQPPAEDPKPQPKLSETPKPVAKPAPPEPAPEPARKPARRPAVRREPPQRNPAPKERATQPTAPPEGTIEIYDAEGNLIRRQKIQEERR